MKRLFDLLIACSLLVVFFFIIVIISILVRIKLGSPILFKQKRPGLHGQPFYVYKFRTMTDERDTDGQLLPDHIRLTPFGQFMRKYSLDELPQLFNVVKGDISLVGPRPLLMEICHYIRKNKHNDIMLDLVLLDGLKLMGEMLLHGKKNFN